MSTQAQAGNVTGVVEVPPEHEYESYRIWWTTREEAVGLGTELDKVPSDICESLSLRIRYGSAGTFTTCARCPGLRSIPWPEDKPTVLRILRERRTGVVFPKADIGTIKSLPGFITDLHLNVVE
jgi:hypothetical protein